MFEKNTLLRITSGYYHNSAGNNNFYCFQPQYRTSLYTGRSIIPSQILFYENNVGRIFVSKFYHDKTDTNFLKFLSYVGEHRPNNLPCKYRQIGKKMYKYKKKTAGPSARSIQSTDLGWTFLGNIFQKYWSHRKGVWFFLLKPIHLTEKFLRTITEFTKYRIRNRRSIHCSNTIIILSSPTANLGKNKI